MICYVSVWRLQSVDAVVLSLESDAPGVPLMRARSLLKLSAWKRLMARHPDVKYATTIIDYISNGAPILYDGPESNRICPNWNSVLDFKKDVVKTLERDVMLGRKSGPFAVPPVSNFIASPLGAFAKKRTGKVLVIHDLSWPPNESVNFYIPGEKCSVQYITVDDAVLEIKKRGPGCLMSKIDLQDAYKNIVVRPKDWHYLGSTWVGDDGLTVFLH